MAQLKVLMVAGNMHVGGIENQLMHLARNASREKFQFDFTSDKPDAFYRKEIEELGGKFILIPKMNWRNPFPYCRAMYHVMRQGKYDIVHSHELFHSGITLLIAKLAGIPCRFVHAHNWRDDDGTGKKRSKMRTCYNAVMRWMINQFSTTEIACSTWAGKFLYGEKNIKKKKYHLVFNSVDTAKFLDNYDRVETGEFCEENGWKNVINVARISKVKNQEFLVRIAEEFRKKEEKIRILCVGSGDEDDVKRVRDKIEEKNLWKYIKLLGVRKDVDVLMRKSSAFVLPSHYEGMPLVMIEAQTSGLHCVSAATYSPEVDFGIGTVIWLSLDDDVKTWAGELMRAVNKKRPDKRVIEKVVKEKAFDSKMFAQAMCELYEEDYRLRGKKND